MLVPVLSSIRKQGVYVGGKSLESAHAPWNHLCSVLCLLVRCVTIRLHKEQLWIISGWWKDQNELNNYLQYYQMCIIIIIGYCDSTFPIHQPVHCDPVLMCLTVSWSQTCFCRAELLCHMAVVQRFSKVISHQSSSFFRIWIKAPRADMWPTLMRKLLKPGSSDG